MERTYIIVIEDGRMSISYVHPKSALNRKIEWEWLYGDSDYIKTTPLQAFKLMKQKLKESK